MKFKARIIRVQYIEIEREGTSAIEVHHALNEEVYNGAFDNIDDWQTDRRMVDDVWGEVDEGK